jgi:hypothetical protein
VVALPTPSSSEGCKATSLSAGAAATAFRMRRRRQCASAEDNVAVPDGRVTASMVEGPEGPEGPGKDVLAERSGWAQVDGLAHATARVRPACARLQLFSPASPTGRPWPLAGSPQCTAVHVTEAVPRSRPAGLAHLVVVRGAANHSEGNIGGGEGTTAALSFPSASVSLSIHHSTSRLVDAQRIPLPLPCGPAVWCRRASSPAIAR